MGQEGVAENGDGEDPERGTDGFGEGRDEETGWFCLGMPEACCNFSGSQPQGVFRGIVGTLSGRKTARLVRYLP